MLFKRDILNFKKEKGTVQFKWDKSHPQMEDNEFYQKLGIYDSKGVMVRRIVTEIVR